MTSTPYSKPGLTGLAIAISGGSEPDWMPTGRQNQHQQQLANLEINPSANSTCRAWQVANFAPACAYHLSLVAALNSSPTGLRSRAGQVHGLLRAYSCGAMSRCPPTRILVQSLRSDYPVVTIQGLGLTGLRMTPDVTTRSAALCAVVLVSIGCVIAVSLLVLAGWVWDVELLKSFLHPERVAMNPLTAVCFVFCAASLLLQRTPEKSPQARLVARLLAAACVVMRRSGARFPGHGPGAPPRRVDVPTAVGHPRRAQPHGA